MHSNDRIDVVIKIIYGQKLFQLYWEKLLFIQLQTIISYNQIFKTNINNIPMSV